MEKEEKSYRGMIIGVILRNLFKKNQFDTVDNFLQVVENALNSNLKFETTVSSVRIGDRISGSVYFEDENGIHFKW
jgi:hypothetical protein